MRSFFTDTRYFWLGCTEFPPCNYEVSRGLRLLYALELGYYIQVRRRAGSDCTPFALQMTHQRALQSVTVSSLSLWQTAPLMSLCIACCSAC